MPRRTRLPEMPDFGPPGAEQPSFEGPSEEQNLVGYRPIGPVALAPITSPSSIDGLIGKAIEHQVPVESLERLLTMRQTLKAEQAREAFLAAMTAFQAECPIIGKTSTVGGGSYSYNYASLDHIVSQTSELRAKHGFSYRFDSRFEMDPPGMAVVCYVSHSAGHTEQAEFRSPIDAGSRMNKMQQSASALTYAKRYAFQNAFGILTGNEDDDGRGAGKPSDGQGGAKRLASPPRRELIQNASDPTVGLPEGTPAPKARIRNPITIRPRDEERIPPPINQQDIGPADADIPDPRQEELQELRNAVIASGIAYFGPDFEETVAVNAITDRVKERYGVGFLELAQGQLEEILAAFEKQRP